MYVRRHVQCTSTRTRIRIYDRIRTVTSSVLDTGASTNKAYEVNGVYDTKIRDPS